MDKDLFTGAHVAFRATSKRVLRQPDGVAELPGMCSCAGGHRASDWALGPTKLCLQASSALVTLLIAVTCGKQLRRGGCLGSQYEGREHEGGGSMLAGVDPGSGSDGSRRLLAHIFREQKTERRQKARQTPPHPCPYNPIHAPHPCDPRPPARVYLWKVHILPQQHHQLGARSSNPGGFVFKPYYLPLGGLLCTREEEGYNALTKASKLEICFSPV